MKIYLDDIVFSLQKIGGISVFWSEFLEKVSQSATDKVCLIKVGRPKNRLSVYRWNKERLHDVKIPIKMLRVLPLLKKLDPKSVFHSSYLRVSLQKDVCNIVTIHDLAAEDKMIGGIRRYLKLGLQAFAIKRADGIVCVSKSTRKRLLSHYPHLEEHKVKTILHGCSPQFFPVKGASPEKIILFVGGRNVYKNFATCLKVMKLLKDYQLVMVGGGALTSHEREKITKSLAGRYVHHEELDTASLNLFYNKAHCLFYPTVYEGFGLPVLEAMTAGCAVVSTDIPAIKEVAREGAMLIEDPYNVKAFRTAIRKLEDDHFRREWVVKGLARAKDFSLDVQFSETMGFYADMHQLKFA